jgi:hypothetical protein
VTTAQIYKGSIAFIVLQLIMVVAIMIHPNLVLSGLDKPVPVDEGSVLEQLQQGRDALEQMSNPQKDQGAEPDPMRDLLDAVKEQKPGAPASAPN